VVAVDMKNNQFMHSLLLYYMIYLFKLLTTTKAPFPKPTAIHPFAGTGGMG
jgi:hypothetical protein